MKKHALKAIWVVEQVITIITIFTSSFRIRGKTGDFCYDIST